MVDSRPKKNQIFWYYIYKQVYILAHFKKFDFGVENSTTTKHLQKLTHSLTLPLPRYIICLSSTKSTLLTTMFSAYNAKPFIPGQQWMNLVVQMA